MFILGMFLKGFATVILFGSVFYATKLVCEYDVYLENKKLKETVDALMKLAEEREKQIEYELNTETYD